MSGVDQCQKIFPRFHAVDRRAVSRMDRLADYQRGTLAVGGGSVTPSTMSLINSQQGYNLDALGNWTSTSYTPVGSASTTQMRVHNLLNEVTSYESVANPCRTGIEMSPF